jgi:menaquinone-dependent protoporphyrinogen oxidase
MSYNLAMNRREKHRRRKKMATLMVYASKHGSVEKSLNSMKKSIKDQTLMIPIKEYSNGMLDTYRAVVIGCSVHAGTVQKEVVDFVKGNLQMLSTKKTVVVINCADQEKYTEYFENAFGKNILSENFSLVYGGFGYYFEKMGFLERTLIKMISKMKENKEFINEKGLRDAAAKLE